MRVFEQGRVCRAVPRRNGDSQIDGRVYSLDGVDARGRETRGKVPSWSQQVWETYERVTGKPRPEMWRTDGEEERPPRNDEPPV